jgi:hypothetical protein
MPIFTEPDKLTSRRKNARGDILGENGQHRTTDREPLVFVWLLKHFFLDFHVSELVGVEYLTTIQTFDVFNVLFTRYYADFWVFAGGVHLGDLGV